MIPTSIIDQWHSAFSLALPIGYHCRAVLRDRWLRIHSLPHGKRYAESASEQVEILKRHNAVATNTLGQGSNCILFTAQFGECQEWSPINVIPDLPKYVFSHRELDDEPEETIQFFALEINWAAGSFDDLLLAIAEDEVDWILFANLSKRSAYAPYDGGADLFMSSQEQVKMARQQFTAWLSAREDGL